MLYIYILVILLFKLCLSDVITLNEPNTANRYTYDDKALIGTGAYGKVFKGLSFARNYFHFIIINRFMTYFF